MFIVFLGTCFKLFYYQSNVFGFFIKFDAWAFCMQIKIHGSFYPVTYAQPRHIFTFTIFLWHSFTYKWHSHFSELAGMKVSAICYIIKRLTWIKLHLLLRELKMLNKQYVLRLFMLFTPWWLCSRSSFFTFSIASSFLSFCLSSSFYLCDGFRRIEVELFYLLTGNGQEYPKDDSELLWCLLLYIHELPWPLSFLKELTVCWLMLKICSV